MVVKLNGFVQMNNIYVYEPTLSEDKNSISWQCFCCFGIKSVKWISICPQRF